MAFDLYSDFIEPMYGENKALLGSVNSIFNELIAKGAHFCVAGDLTFSFYGIQQMTTTLDLMVVGSNEDEVVSIEESLIPFGDTARAIPFTINRIKVSEAEMRSLSIEHSLTAFKMQNLPVVAEASLETMVEILKRKRRFSGTETSHFQARLLQMAEAESPDTGYQMSWSELQALKAKR